MQVHILNGDALAEQFPIDGEIVVMRECLMEGPVQASTYDEFWKLRANFLGKLKHAEEVGTHRDLATEFQTLDRIKTISEINLWFDHDLFCQVNMWFVVDYLVQNNFDSPVYRVMPPTSMTNVWNGFGRMTSTDLRNCYDNRIKFKDHDLRLCVDLWHAYREKDLETLSTLGSKNTLCFPFLSNAVSAHLQRFPSGNGRPERRLREILGTGKKDFHAIFSEFWETEGVYGFGDLQVKEMLESLER